MRENYTRVRAKAPASKKPNSSAKKSSVPPTTFVSQTGAKNEFLEHCRLVAETEQFVCVTDQSGKAFLTLTARLVKTGFVTVSAQFFKDNFARCSSLIRDGVAFRLTLRKTNRMVYARRHTSYTDPLDPVINEWRENMVEAAMADAKDSGIAKLARDLAAFASQQSFRGDEDRALSLDRHKALVRGITRMAIGHSPFDEGQILSNRDPEPMRDPRTH
jgi:hypothetical protein